MKFGGLVTVVVVGDVCEGVMTSQVELGFIS